MKRAPKGTPAGGQFTTQERAEASVHLHIGVNPIARPVVTALGESHPDITRVISDDDSWRVWGEPSEGGEPKHVVLEVEGVEKARELAGILEGTEMLRRSGGARDVSWVVTDAQDWSQAHISDEDAPTRAADLSHGRQLMKSVTEGTAGLRIR